MIRLHPKELGFKAEQRVHAISRNGEVPMTNRYKKAVIEVIKGQAHRLRGALGTRIGKQMRVVPELLFYVDDSLDRAEEIDKLLKGE